MGSCGFKGKVKAGGDGVEASGKSGRRGGEGDWDDANPDPETSNSFAGGDGEGRTVEGHAGDERALVTLPGFRMTRGGGSRVFVEISSNVQVKEIRAPGKITLRLSGVTVPERVNMMDLPTMHFPTPVGRVRLVQVDKDAELIIELRSPSQSKLRVNQSAGGTVVSVDFPKLGDSVSAATAIKGGEEPGTNAPAKDY